MPVSNGSAFNIECTDISGWTDGDTGEAVSSQVTFDGKSCFKFDTVTSADTNDSTIRSLDFGSVEAIGNNLVVSLSVYCDAIGTQANSDFFRFKVERSDWRFDVRFCSDGLFIHDGAAYNEVGTNIVVQDVWQEWTFDIDLSAGVASANCDVYLNNVLKASNFDCSATGIYGDGYLEFRQYGYGANNRISYVDWLKIGDAFEGEATTTTSSTTSSSTSSSSTSSSTSTQALQAAVQQALQKERHLIEVML